MVAFGYSAFFFVIGLIATICIGIVAIVAILYVLGSLLKLLEFVVNGFEKVFKVSLFAVVASIYLSGIAALFIYGALS